MKIFRSNKTRRLKSRSTNREITDSVASNSIETRSGNSQSVADMAALPKFVYPESIYSFDYVNYRENINKIIPSEIDGGPDVASQLNVKQNEVKCFFCSEIMHVLSEFREGPSDGFFERLNVEMLQLCRCCGWWIHVYQEDIQFEDVGGRAGAYSDWCVGGFDYQRTIHYGALKVFDKTDEKAPVDEVRRYLLARYEERSNIHPRMFEETVASVFSDYGYNVELTSYHNDGGVDIILEREAKTYCVQVKRYNNKIGVQEIRGFLGALLLNKQSNGIFVTTSDYTLGAKAAADNAGLLGYKVELIDHEKLYDYLKCTAKIPFESIADWKASNPTLRYPSQDTIPGNGNFRGMA